MDDLKPFTTEPVALIPVLCCASLGTDISCIIMQVMQRLKIAKNLNIRQAMLVENAYYICRPPDRPTIEKRERTPLQQYMRHLVHDQLTQDDTKQVSLQPPGFAV